MVLIGRQATVHKINEKTTHLKLEKSFFAQKHQHMNEKRIKTAGIIF